MTTDDLGRADRLATRLDEVLPPGSDQIRLLASDEPAVKAAARIAGSPRPALSPETRDWIEGWVLAQADSVFGLRPIFTRRRVTRWAAAACLLFTLLAALLVASSYGDTAHRTAPLVDQSQTGTYPGLIQAPSSADTSLYIPQDAVSNPSLTEIGSGSTSIFILPPAR